MESIYNVNDLRNFLARSGNLATVLNGYAHEISWRRVIERLLSDGVIDRFISNNHLRMSMTREAAVDYIYDNMFNHFVYRIHDDEYGIPTLYVRVVLRNGYKLKEELPLAVNEFFS